MLVFINRHRPTMNIVEEERGGTDPGGGGGGGLQSWPLQLIKHLT